MLIYVFLYKLTDQGIKTIKNFPEDAMKALAAGEAMGGNC